jgi:hypothetical protein
LGLIVGSTQRLACQFKGNTGWTQDYVGRLNRIGLDIGYVYAANMKRGIYRIAFPGTPEIEVPYDKVGFYMQAWRQGMVEGFAAVYHGADALAEAVSHFP